MDTAYKKRAVNTGFITGIVLIIIGGLMVAFVSSGWGTAFVAAGVIAAVIGGVFALIPAKD